MMQVIKTGEGQTLLDIAMQYTGDVSRAVEIAHLNGLQLTDDLEAGMELQVPEAAIDKQYIAEAFAENDLHPASGETELPNADDEVLEGIDYWTIEDDFIIQ